MTPSDDAGPWNPGIQSPVPAEFRHLATIFRPEYVSTSIQAADELHDLTGIAATELVAFRPQRLALHELLIRITADFSVADGSRIEDLGINFRQMTRQLLVHHIEPAMADIVSEFDRVRQRLAQVIHGALSQQPYVGVALSSTGRMHRGGLFRRFTTRRVQAAPPATDHTWEVARIATYERQAVSAADELDRAAYRALARVMSALFNRHGRAWGSRNLIASLVTDLACNEVGSDQIGQLLEPLLQRAASVEG
ncbi:MAG TPA: hypothetical protein VK251_08930, partial [Steroidobacteraceae bacterium]|nr:hypothetical protein [Steroidobacteraceae bacterium]